MMYLVFRKNTKYIITKFYLKKYFVYNESDSGWQIIFFDDSNISQVSNVNLELLNSNPDSSGNN